MPATIDKPVTITLNYNLASAGVGQEATKELIAGFEKVSNVKVEPIAVPSNEIITRCRPISSPPATA